jgi:hypothetical protein
MPVVVLGAQINCRGNLFRVFHGKLLNAVSNGCLDTVFNVTNYFPECGV